MEGKEDAPVENGVVEGGGGEENGVESYPAIHERGFYSEIIADDNAAMVEVSFLKI